LCEVHLETGDILLFRNLCGTPLRIFGALYGMFVSTRMTHYWIGFLSVLKASEDLFWLLNKAQRDRIAPC
jgi:hypothetical protein